MGLGTLGKVVVATAGTPVRISASTFNVNTAFFQYLASNAGAQLYIGLSGLNKSTLANVFKILEKTAASTPEDSWILQHSTSSAGIDLGQIWIDADTSGDGMLIGYLT